MWVIGAAFIFLLSQSAAATALAPTSTTRFNTLLSKDGLDIGDIRSIYQDSVGYMWFGGSDGLIRYDGTRFEHFRSEGAEPGSLSHNVVWKILEDKQNQLWVATDSGLNLFDRDQNTFSRYFFSDSTRTLLHDAVIDIEGHLWFATVEGLAKFNTQTRQFTRYKSSLYEINGTDNLTRALEFDGDGMLWFGTYASGLNRFDPRDETFERFEHDNIVGKAGSAHKGENSLNKVNMIGAIREGTDGTLWIGSEAGIFYFDHTHQQLRPLTFGKDATPVLSGIAITEIEQDDAGNLWLGTPYGLRYLNLKTETIVAIVNKPQASYSLANNVIRKIYQDRNKDIWVGTFPEGISFLNRSTLAFETVEHERGKKDGLNNKSVLSFLENDDGKLWVGTDGGGINVFDFENASTSYYKNLAGKLPGPQQLSGNAILSMQKDIDGAIWAGTWNAGLNRIDPATGTIQHYFPDYERQDSLRNNNIWQVYLDRKGTLWIGSIGGSLYQFNRPNNSFIPILHDPHNSNSIASTIVWAILQSKDGILWIGTQLGLNKYDPETEIFTLFTHDPAAADTLSNDIVTTLYEDRENYLWIGTRSGLNRLDLRTYEIKRYGAEQGLQAKTVASIEEDDEGNLWLGTKTGLIRFNKKREHFRDYTTENGSQNSQFNYNASIRLKNGDFLFGSTQGYTRFNPANLSNSVATPSVVLRDFKVFAESVAIGNTKGSILKKTIDRSDNITLTHHESMFSVEYAALDFRSPNKIQYAYMLTPFDKKWNYVGNQRTATYTNLDPGEYTFFVKASNNEGEWGEQAKSINLVILPPPWQTWWAYTFYIIIAVSIMMLYVKAQKDRLNKEREINRKLHHLDKIKDEFLANTSHELRTPIHGIIGLAESLIDRLGSSGSDTHRDDTHRDDSYRNDLQLIVKSGKRLGTLINDILDFSSLKNGEINLIKRAIDISSLTNVILDLAAPLARGKSLSLQNHIAIDTPAVYADEDRLQQILFNLIGNAIKFTPEGTIRLSASEHGDCLHIHVTDSGIGIAAEKLARIFDSFEQGDGSSVREYSGTGLGLSITKHLVEINGGRIFVESQPGAGSTFSFTLPKATPALVRASSAAAKPLADKPFPAPPVATPPVATPPVKISATSAVTPLLAENHAQTAPYEIHCSYHILIVDDEPINRQVLIHQLSLKNYQVTEVGSGEEALTQIQREDKRFDLVLLDLMMPKMSGFEVAEAIRKQHNTNDLPIIFLTAKNQTMDTVMGLEKGANDYLVKPVAREELLARVETQLRVATINRHLEEIVAQRTHELREEHEKLKRTQSQLVQAENIATLSTLVTGMAHELNNPTNFIVFGTYNLQCTLNDLKVQLSQLASTQNSPIFSKHITATITDIDDTIATICSGSQRVKDIVNDLQMFSHTDQSSQQNIILRDNLVRCSNLIQPKYERNLTIEIDQHDDIHLFCDSLKLDQAFFYVITNACQAIVEKQRQQAASNLKPNLKPNLKSDLKSNPEPDLKPGTVRILANQNADNICVSFSDNGCGMDKNTLQNIFNPFFTTREVGAGAGLGLSMTYSIIRQHDGKIEVESTPGVGTTITFILPIKNALPTQEIVQADVLP